MNILRVIPVLMLPFASWSQDVTGKTYINYWGPAEPGQKGFLCQSNYTFYRSTGFYASGCEAHVRDIGSFVYTSDSTQVVCDFFRYNTYVPYTKIVRKKIEGQQDIHVKVIDITGRSLFPQIAVIQLRRKKDRIKNRLYAVTNEIIFKRYEGKRMFWTVAGLYPLFFAEMHFSFDEPYNYYELYLSLPEMCVTWTEGKFWVEGIDKLKMTDSTHLASTKTIYELNMAAGEQ